MPGKTNPSLLPYTLDTDPMDLWPPTVRDLVNRLEALLADRPRVVYGTVNVTVQAGQSAGDTSANFGTPFTQPPRVVITPTGGGIWMTSVNASLTAASMGVRHYMNTTQTTTVVVPCHFIAVGI